MGFARTAWARNPPRGGALSSPCKKARSVPFFATPRGKDFALRPVRSTRSTFCDLTVAYQFSPKRAEERTVRGGVDVWHCGGSLEAFSRHGRIPFALPETAIRVRPLPESG